MCISEYSDKEYAHRGCIGAKLQGEPTPLGCNDTISDFRRPDGSVRFFVIQLILFVFYCFNLL